MESSGKPSQAERLQALRLQVLSLADQLQALTSETKPDRLPWLQERINQVQELVDFVEAGPEPASTDKKSPPPTPKQRKEFGKLLRDKRSAAGFSRMQLARRAKLSDATIKFIEMARHPPSRATLIRLMAVAELNNEPRFLRHMLPPGARGDLLLFDMQLAQADVTNLEHIKKRDKQWAPGVTSAEATWLSGPIWRHCKDVVSVDFHWDLDTHLPLPGSYALDAVATVHGPLDVERRFSMFQYRRYAPDQVAVCLLGLGWEELGNWPYGSAEQPASLRLFRKCTEPLAHE